MTAETGETRNKFLEVDILGAQIDILPVDGYNCGIQMNEVDAMAFDQTKYITQWEKENCEQIKIRVPKGKRDILKKTAEAHNLSVSKMFLEAIEEKYGVDLSKPE